MTTKKKLDPVDKAAGRTPSPVRPTPVRPSPPAPVSRTVHVVPPTKKFSATVTGPVKKKKH